jgi:D-alanyl-D-alanine carboxypeptidase (penicillin-binding protein 5/6)
MRKSILLLSTALSLAAPLAQAAKHHHHEHAPGTGAVSPGDDSDKFIGTLAAKDGLIVTAGPSGPPPVPDSPAGDAATPAPPTLPAVTSYVLMDGTTGAVLAEAAPNLQVPPASLVKLMTAHVVYQALHAGSLKSDQTVPVSVEAWHAGGSSMFIDPKSTVTVDQLLHGLLIVSGNDAAVALAEQTSGSVGSFVQVMNKDAAAMGLTNTAYVTVNGLPPDDGEHTTAMDVAILSHNILQDEPEVLNITKLESYTYDNITQATWNPVLAKDPTVDGLKTGLTKESGHCIDASAIRNNMRLIAVVMGGPTFSASTAAVESLLGYGEKFFSDTQVTTAGAPLETLQSGALDSGAVPVGAAQTVTLTLPNDALGHITHSISYTADLTPGATKGEILGSATFTLNGKTLATVPVEALADSPAASFFTRLQRKLSKTL